MSSIFQSCSESQIAISAWNYSSHLSLFSPFHMNPHLLLPHCPLDTSPRPLVQSSGCFLTCRMWLIRFPTSCHRCVKAPKAGEKPQCHAEASVCAFLQLYASVTSLLRRSRELGKVTSRSELWLLSCPPHREAASFRWLPPFIYRAPMAWLWKTYTIFFLVKTFLIIVGYY